MFEDFFQYFFPSVMGVIVIGGIMHMVMPGDDSRDILKISTGIFFWIALFQAISWAIFNNISGIDRIRSEYIALSILIVFTIYRPNKNFVSMMMFEALSYVLLIGLFIYWGGPLIFMIYHIGSGKLAHEGFFALVDDKFYQCLLTGLGLFAVFLIAMIAGSYEPKGSIGAMLRKALNRRVPESPASQVDDEL